MANKKHVAVVGDGPGSIDAWRIQHIGKLNLSGANLSHSVFNHAILSLE